MAEQEQRYRINVTVQPYEDLKTFIGRALVIGLLVVAAARTWFISLSSTSSSRYS